MYERNGVNAAGMCGVGVASHCRCAWCRKISKVQVHPRGCHLILEIIGEAYVLEYYAMWLVVCSMMVF